jgi:hypothetical protein
MFYLGCGGAALGVVGLICWGLNGLNGQARRDAERRAREQADKPFTYYGPE